MRSNGRCSGLSASLQHSHGMRLVSGNRAWRLSGYRAGLRRIAVLSPDGFGFSSAGKQREGKRVAEHVVVESWNRFIRHGRGRRHKAALLNMYKPTIGNEENKRRLGL